MRVCTIDLASGESHVEASEAVGPLDLALARPGALVLGSGRLASPEVPGSHRLVVAGHSALWDGFYVSTLGSAAVQLRALELDALVLTGRAPALSALVVPKEGRPRLSPVSERLWQAHGVRSMIAGLRELAQETGPRILATGAGARDTLFGAIASALPEDDACVLQTWAGRGGFGSRLVRDHGLAGLVLDAPAVPRPAPRADAVKLEATKKYRYHPLLGVGGTLGANLATLREKLLFMNHRSVLLSPEERERAYEEKVLRGFLAEHREDLRAPGATRDCGETCPAVCKKVVRGVKKDYQPFQAFGPNLGIFAQRLAERVAEEADALGLDSVEAGAWLGWRLECEGFFGGEPDGEAICERAVELLHGLAQSPGASGLARAARAAPAAERDRALYVAQGEGGVAPAQYWAPGLLAPVPLAGKYHTDYHFDWRPPRALGRACAERLVAELTLDNLGLCRFEREWAEPQMLELLQRARLTPELGEPHHRELARRLSAAARPRPPETERAARFLAAWCDEVRRDGPPGAELDAWHARFTAHPVAAARAFWQELGDGLAEGLA